MNKVLPVIDFDYLNWNIIPSSNDVTNFINKIDICIINSTKKMSRKCNSFNYKLKPWITKGNHCFYQAQRKNVWSKS